MENDSKRLKILIGILIFVSCIFLLQPNFNNGVIIKYFSDYGQSQNMTKKECKDLYEIAQSEILKLLEYPETAQFPEFSDNNQQVTMSKNKEGKKIYCVIMHVDSEDSKGIVDRDYYFIGLNMESKDSYTINFIDSDELYKDMLLKD